MRVLCSRAVWFALAAAGAVVGAGGGGAATIACTPPSSRCVDDGQCDALGDGFRRCELGKGACICIDDRGCGSDEFCNAAGDCQTRAGCKDNGDCNAGLFCDVTSGNCVPEHICGDEQTCCTLDSHCAFRQICDVLQQTCVAGCREDADCVLGEGCIGAGFGRVGVCGTECAGDAQCPFGQLCNLTSTSCQLDTRGPYCLGCTGGVQSDDCGDFGNFCLLDTVNGGSYCGVDCGLGQVCPSGYECRDVIILPSSTLPTCALPEVCVKGVCDRSAAACAVDEDCPDGPPGSTCPRADVGNCELDVNVPCAAQAECDAAGAGLCLKQVCRQREGAAFGVCSCTKDTDCPRDRCVDAAPGVLGHCELSGRSCFEDVECDVITCVEGGCLIGRNCKPANDRTCADLLD